jgi:hypothetical protein
MLALAFTFAATALTAVPSASVTCADGPASCDGAWAAPVAFADDVAADDGATGSGPREYATPAEIDCPEPPQPQPVLASGDCSSGPAAFWYRVSRYPESELPAGRLAPSSRRAHGAGSVTGGLPDVGHLTKVTTQPIALVALPALFPAVSRRPDHIHAQALPARALAPPDRPPRA